MESRGSLPHGEANLKIKIKIKRNKRWMKKFGKIVLDMRHILKYQLTVKYIAKELIK
jgi:hypothetical protein